MRSRRALLGAAEQLFANRGYEATTLAAVGEAAGLSRGAAGYFFASKEALYHAMLSRLFAEVRARLLSIVSTPPPDADRPAVVAWVVSEYVDFLRERPTFIALMEREMLAGAVRLRQIPEHGELVRDSAAAISAFFGPTLAPDPALVLLNFMALAWFPLAHPPLLDDLGLDPDEFAEPLKRQVSALLVRGLGLE